MNASNIPSIFLYPTMSTKPIPTPIDVVICQNYPCDNIINKRIAPSLTVSYNNVYVFRCCIKFYVDPFFSLFLIGVKILIGI